MPHHWDIIHARWVPTIPQVGTATAVFAAPLLGAREWRSLHCCPRSALLGADHQFLWECHLRLWSRAYLHLRPRRMTRWRWLTICRLPQCMHCQWTWAIIQDPVHKGTYLRIATAMHIFLICLPPPVIRSNHKINNFFNILFIFLSINLMD